MGRTGKTRRKKMAAKNTKIRWGWFVPAALWMGVIFYMSSRNGADSSAVSNPITEFIVALFQNIRNDEAASRDRMMAVVEVMVRKGAHMTEYAILFGLVLLAIKKADDVATEAFADVCSLAVTFAYACSDELHQLFVAERAGRAGDVAIDMCGALIAWLLITVFKTTRGRIVAGFIAALIMMAILLFLMLWNF